MARRDGPIDKRLIAIVPGIGWFVLRLGALAAAASAAVIAQSLVAGEVIEQISAGAGVGTTLIIVLGIAVAMRAFIASIQEHSVTSASARFRVAMRNAFLRRAAFARDCDVATATTTATVRIESLDPYFSRAIPALVAALVVPVVVIATVAVIDWSSALVLAVTLGVAPLLMGIVGVTTGRFVEHRQIALDHMAGQFVDLVRGITTLKIYGRTQAQDEAIETSTDRLRKCTMATLRVAFMSSLVLDVLATLSVAIVAVSIGLRLAGGHLGLAESIAVLLLAPEVFAPVRAAGAQFHAAQDARGVADGFEALEEVVQKGSTPGAGYERLMLALRGVSFRYRGGNEDALDRVDVVLNGPGITAIIGPSGSGKTTLLDVLRGELDLARGSATNGGLAVELSSEEWRQRCAWVPQRPRLTEETVAEQVRLADQNLTAADLERLLDGCAAPHSTASLGEGGTMLSAGQKRRVAMAMAVARARNVLASGRTPLVILDEPSEDLDEATATVVAMTIESLAQLARVVVATHDKALADIADERISLTGGRVVSIDKGRLRSAPRQEVPSEFENRSEMLPPMREERTVRVRELLGSAVGAKARIAWSVLVAAAGGVVSVALIATSTWLICRASQHPSVQALALAIVGVRFFALSRALLRYVERLTSHDGALRIMGKTRARVFAALVPLAPASLACLRRGDLLRRFTTDVDSAQDLVVRSVIPLATSTATWLCAVVAVSFVDPVAGGVLGCALILGSIVIPFVVFIKTFDSRELGELRAARDSSILTTLEGAVELRAYGALSRAIDRIAFLDSRILRAERSKRVFSAAGIAASGVVNASGLVLSMVLCVAISNAGPNDWIGVAVSLVVMLVAFDASVNVSPALAVVGSCRDALGRVGSVLASRPAFSDGVGYVIDDAVRPASVTSNDLAVRPGGDTALVIEFPDHRFDADVLNAIAGPSGSGKSTLLSAVMRLLPAESGSISIGEIDVAEIASEKIPDLVTGSLQGDHVFIASVRDNLRLGDPTASDVTLVDALGEVGLRDWLDGLSDGLDEVLGIDGEKMSGGQRQRLLVARALLNDSAIVVVDEPTAHLDEAAATMVMRALRGRVGQRLVLISTHDAGVMQACEKLLIGARSTPFVGSGR